MCTVSEYETKSPPGTTTFHWQPRFPTSPVSFSPQPGQLITSSRHWLFLHNNKIAINIYGNTVWTKQVATSFFVPAVCTRLCISLRGCVCVYVLVECVFACVPAVCTQTLCSEGIACFDVLGCGQLLIPLLACTALMQAALVLLPEKWFISMLSGAR